MLALRIGDREREQAVAVLRQQCADGRLTLDEFSERTDLVYLARTTVELESALADLLPLPAPTPPPAPPRTRRRRLRLQLSVFGGHRQTGRWRPASHTVAVALFGSLTLDLRDAVVDERELTIHAFAVFGSVHLTALEGTELDCSAIGVFGSVGGSVEPPLDDAGSLIVRVDGAAVFGSITTRTRPTRAMERERRAARKAQRRAGKEARRSSEQH